MSARPTIEHDFELATELVAPPIVVLVRAPTRSRLATVLPPTLILLGALALTAYQFRPSAEPRSSVIASSRPVIRRPVADAPAIDSGKLMLTEFSDVVAEQPSPPAEAGEEVPANTPSPALEPLVEAEDAVLAANEPERPEAEIVWDDIEAEADAARLEREKAEKLRGESFAQDQASQIARLNRARGDAEANRAEFLNDLKKMLVKHGRRSGLYISHVVTLYGREVEPEMQAAAFRLRQHLKSSRATPERCVLAYRRIGLPEPCILDELSHLLRGTIGSRRGPRNATEVLYFAARKLVSVPVR